MLEKIPSGVGRALRGARAGFGKTVSESEAFAAAPAALRLVSPAFEDGTSIPPIHTADGEGLSPRWRSAARRRRPPPLR